MRWIASQVVLGISLIFRDYSKLRLIMTIFLKNLLKVSLDSFIFFLAFSQVTIWVHFDLLVEKMSCSESTSGQLTRKFRLTRLSQVISQLVAWWLEFCCPGLSGKKFTMLIVTQKNSFLLMKTHIRLKTEFYAWEFIKTTKMWFSCLMLLPKYSPWRKSMTWWNIVNQKLMVESSPLKNLRTSLMEPIKKGKVSLLNSNFSTCPLSNSWASLLLHSWCLPFSSRLRLFRVNFFRAFLPLNQKQELGLSSIELLQQSSSSSSLWPSFR